MAHRLQVRCKLARLHDQAVGSYLRQPPHALMVGECIGGKRVQTRLSTSAALGRYDISPAKPTSSPTSLPLTWPHKGWDVKVVQEVVPSHRKPRTLSDRIAWRVIRLCRWGMDFLTGMPSEQKAGSNYRAMSESQWLVRFVFLETVAGIPGAVAGSLRHLHSIRRFKLDQGWIKTLLEESYNERMHLLTFLDMYRPGKLMRLMVFLAQGIFYNTMFVGYLLSPSFCHRLVGYLEDEAVATYTKCLDEIDKGRLPQWTDPNFKIPDLAVKYWNMPEGKRTMRDLILYIRADEASHRGVNHTLANLDQVSDPNPFIEGHSNMNHMHLAAVRPAGLEREEVLEKYAR